MMSSSDDMIYVDTPTFSSLTDGDVSDSESFTSDDSAIYVIRNTCPPSLHSALEAANYSEDEALEQREDIKQGKEIPTKLAYLLKFKDEAALMDAIDRVGAREHADKELENEIKQLILIQENKDLVNEDLKKAAQVAYDSANIACKTATDGHTTVKRAMEVFENAFPVYVEACNKSYEDNKLSDEVMKELNAYEDCLHTDKQASINIDVMALKEIEAFKHLERCIELAEADVNKISEKRKNEILQERLDSFILVKKEVDATIADEIREVDDYLSSCEKDLIVISKLKEEQKTRFSKAKISYETRDKRFQNDIDINNQKQTELRKQLKRLEDEQFEYKKQRNFQGKVQKRACEINEQVLKQLNNLESSISDINARASSSKLVMDSMKTCGNGLLDASIFAEEQYLEQLKALEIEAKTRYRFGLAKHAVEQKVIIDNCTKNIDDYLERMKYIKQDLQKAVQRRQEIVAKKEEENLKEYTNERKKEQQKKKDALKQLSEIMKKLEDVNAFLIGIGTELDSVDDMYERRQQELAENLAPLSNFSSLEFNEDEELEAS